MNVATIFPSSEWCAQGSKFPWLTSLTCHTRYCLLYFLANILALNNSIFITSRFSYVGWCINKRSAVMCATRHNCRSAVNGFSCQASKPEGCVLCRESQNCFCFGRGINSKALQLESFVVTATKKKMRVSAHYVFPLAGFGAAKPHDLDLALNLLN